MTGPTYMQVWLVWGDGSVGYSVAEFDTAMRHHIPIIALVGNDAAWSQIERDQVPILGDNVGSQLAYTPYHEVSTGYGGDGAEVSDWSHASLTASILRAQASAKGGVSFLINVLIGKTDFREGSISV
jgi:acetolactate synthase-like protein